METKRENPDTDKTRRRRGANFDTLAHVYRDVREFIFTNSFIMRNRPGASLGTDNDPLSTGFVKVFNILEAYFDQAPSLIKGINALIFGRTGKGERRNTSLIEFAADYRSDIGDALGYVNGVVRARVSREGADTEDRAGLYVFDRGSESSSRKGTVNWLVAAEDGQVRLTYMPDADGNPLTDALYDIYITKNGIFLFGIPTGNPGISGALYRDNNGFVKLA